MHSLPVAGAVALPVTDTGQVTFNGNLVRIASPALRRALALAQLLVQVLLRMDADAAFVSTASALYPRRAYCAMLLERDDRGAGRMQ